jgi:hypothetical protein
MIEWKKKERKRLGKEGKERRKRARKRAVGRY